MATLTYTATVVGLYTCSLYATTINASRASVSDVASLSPSSTPIAHLSPLPPPGLSVVFEPAVPTNRVEPAAKTEQKEKQLLSNQPPISSKPNRKNDSLCGKEVREEIVSLPSPWTSWFYNSKAAFAIWTV